MQTPFERLAAVLDNASANYLSEQQRQQQLADQRQYVVQQLADQRQYDEGLTNKNRAYEQEAALVKAGYLSKPVGKNTPEDIAAGAALAAQHALALRTENDARTKAGDDYANRLQAEFLKADAAADPTPTVAEINRARAANPPKSSSRADLQMAEEAAQQMAAQMAAQRAAFAMKDRDEIRYLLSDVIKKGHYPAAPAALGAPAAPAPAPVPAPPAPATPTALGLDEEVARGRITEEVDKAWPEIESDYTLASLGDDAIRERINKKVMRTQVSSAPLSPETSYFVDPSKAEIASRLIALRDDQKAALGRLAKRRPQLEKYASNDEARMQLANAILGLTKTEEAIKKNAFESTAATLAQQ